MKYDRRVLNRVRSRPQGRMQSVVAPVGGWNTRDALDSMPPEDAVVLENWFPEVQKVTVRNGFTSHCDTGENANVETLAEYHSGGTRHLLAAVGSKIFNVTTSSASSLATGLTNARWQTVNFNGQLHGVNGDDDPIAYNGSTISNPAWNGPTLTNLVGVEAFKNRLFFWEKDSQSFWYGGLNSVSGTLTEFPLSRVSNLGGKVVACVTVTHDGGEGVDDYFAIILSSGQVVMYSGTDPGDATAWAITGIYNIGQPVDRRAVVRLGGDVFVTTVDDHISLLSVIKKGRVGVGTSKMSGEVPTVVNAYKTNFGWHAIHYPQGSWLLINIPVTSAKSEQHVMNTKTGAWCKFTGINAFSWSLYNDDIYFGGAGGVVYQADEGTSDAGSDINAEAQQAWTNFGSSTPKIFTQIRHLIDGTGTINLTHGLAFDFGEVLVEQASSSEAAGATWDVADWDVEDWSPEATTRDAWRSAVGEGHSVSQRVKFTGQIDTLSWFRTDFVHKTGFGLT